MKVEYNDKKGFMEMAMGAYEAGQMAIELGKLMGRKYNIHFSTTLGSDSANGGTIQLFMYEGSGARLTLMQEVQAMTDVNGLKSQIIEMYRSVAGDREFIEFLERCTVPEGIKKQEPNGTEHNSALPFDAGGAEFAVNVQ